MIYLIIAEFIVDTIQDLHFPQEFLFGSAVAAFQVEGRGGERKTDWDVFLRHHSTIVRPDEKGPEWWSFNKAAKDIETMHSLGLQVQRLSFEWGRIEPEEGVINHEALAYYKELISRIKNLGMMPMVTINHYVLPEWVAQKGSWENDKILPYFLRFVSLILEHFPDVEYWITINEPNYLLDAGYLSHVYPPQQGNLFTAFGVRSRMIKAHREAYALIKNAIPKAHVGVAFALRWYPPENPHDPLETLYAKIINYIDNFNFIKAMQPADFIGCNYYTGYYLNLNPFKIHPSKDVNKHGIRETKIFGELKKPGAYMTDFDWPIVPDFFLQLLRAINKTFQLPIIITENGLADKEDKYRSFYILTHLVAVWRALQEGIPVQQYIHWSTIDNLEWLEGYRMHFGLVKLDPVNGERKPQRGAHLYSEIVKSKTIAVEKLMKEYLDEKQQEKAWSVIQKLVRGDV